MEALPLHVRRDRTANNTPRFSGNSKKAGKLGHRGQRRDGQRAGNIGQGGWRRARGDAGHAARAGAQGAVALHLHDPSCQPRGGPRRRAEGRRAPGVLRLARDADDGPLLPCAAAGGSHRGQAACEPGVPRHPVPARQPEARQAAELPCLRRRAVLSLAHQGQGRRGFLHGLGGPRRRDDGICQLHPGLRARQGLGPGLAQGPADRADGRCRDRRGQRPRGPARVLEARPQELLVGGRLQPPEPRIRWCRTSSS